MYFRIRPTDKVISRQNDIIIEGDTPEEAITNFANNINLYTNDNFYFEASPIDYEKYLNYIEELSYDLYAVEWVDSHIDIKTKQKVIKEAYKEYTFLNCTDTIAFCMFLYTHLHKYGYNGSLYASKEEFLDNEFQDEQYMHDLLDDEKLFDVYLYYIKNKNK